MDKTIGEYQLRSLGQFNIVLGKNGCGKSTMLRLIEGQLRRSGGCIRYITPERGGQLKLNGNVETQIGGQEWLASTRAVNRANQFRETSVSQFRQLETLVLRKIEQDAATRNNQNFTFDTIMNQMNALLDNAQLARDDSAAFSVFQKGTPANAANAQTAMNVDNLSSGEAELISLAIEIQSFAYTVDQVGYRDKENWLLLDEPDVHLHPDLQYRLMSMLFEALNGKNCHILIATHSTPTVSALGDLADAKVGLMKSRQTEIIFNATTDAFKAVLPIFGAHPLSNVFNSCPVLLVEGDDDVRIWQQACRSSNGGISVWPCAAGSVQDLAEYEELTEDIVAAIYDDAKAYSFRDRDDDAYEIEDLGTVVRARLNCRTAENLLLSDDVLTRFDKTWEYLTAQLDQRLVERPEHPQAAALRTFKETNWDRRNCGIKELRNIVMAEIGSEKPWEVAVGQAIADLKKGRPNQAEHSLTDYLGGKIIDALDLKPTLHDSRSSS